MSFIPTKARRSAGNDLHEFEELPTIVTTTDATPFTIFAYPLQSSSLVMIKSRIVCHDSTFARGAEWRARNVWMRSGGGASSRKGTANGIQDSVFNDFAGLKPSVTFGDPSVSNIAAVIGAGKAATTITWYVWVFVMEAHA